MTMTNRLPMVLLAFALLAAACGGDDGDTETTPEPEETTTTSTLVEETPDDDPPEESSTTTEPVELTASHRGVTEEVIKVGVLSFDWDRLADLGVKFGTSTSDDIAVAALEEINDRGGVHGRLLDLHVVTYLPVGTDEADAACVELTEDEQVFVVVGSTLGESIFCFIELHETAAVMAGSMFQYRLDRARAPYVTTGGDIADRMDTFVAEMEAVGVLEGATVGIVGSVDVSEDNYREAVRAFTDAGYEVVEGLLGDNDEDLTETARQQDVIFERMTEAGVTVTVDTTGVPLSIANAVSAGYQTDQWLLTTTMSGRGLRDAGVDTMFLDGAYGVAATTVGTTGYEATFDDPLVKECVEDIEARTGRTIPRTDDAEINDFSTVISSCAIADILEQGLLNAGPNLTNETFLAGLEAIGPIELPGRTDSRIEPGHMGASDGLTTVRFDGAEGTWSPVE